MNIPLKDGSELFRGLLLLARMDNIVVPQERQWLLNIGKALDFAPSFCETAISEILENTHISGSPPQFSSAEIVHRFLRMGIMISHADDEFHSKEYEWLLTVAAANGVGKKFCHQEMQKYETGEIFLNGALQELGSILLPVPTE